jgi:hypothetical protein
MADYFKQVLDAFKANNESSQDWITFKTYKKGSQCDVGFAYFKHPDSCPKTFKCMYKISLEVDYTIMHENDIYKDISKLQLPFFPRLIGVKDIDINPLDKINLFSPTNKPVKSTALFIECVRGKTLSNIHKSLTTENIYYLMMSTLSISIMAQNKISLSHNDIHGGNIILKSCNKNSAILYVLDKHNKLLIPADGMYPVLIDFGLAHSNTVLESNLYSSIDFYDQGTCPTVPNYSFDMRHTIVSFSQYIYALDKIKGERFCVNITDSTQYQDVNTTSFEYSIPEIVWSLVSEGEPTPFFTNNWVTCLGLMKSLIVLPLESGGNYSSCNIVDSFRSFMNEWKKIESQFISTTYLPWILKRIIDFVNDYRPEYLSSNRRDQRLILEKEFNTQIYNFLGTIVGYVSVVKVSFRAVMESLIMFSSHLEHIFYTITSNCFTDTSKSQAIDFLKIAEVSGVLLFDTFQYNENTNIIVVDNTQNTVDCMKLTHSQSTRLNSLKGLGIKGNLCYKIFTRR